MVLVVEVLEILQPVMIGLLPVLSAYLGYRYAMRSQQEQFKFQEKREFRQSKIVQYAKIYDLVGRVLGQHHYMRLYPDRQKPQRGDGDDPQEELVRVLLWILMVGSPPLVESLQPLMAGLKEVGDATVFDQALAERFQSAANTVILECRKDLGGEIPEDWFLEHEK